MTHTPKHRDERAGSRRWFGLLTLVLALLSAALPREARAQTVAEPWSGGEDSADIPGEYLVDFDDDVSRSDVEGLLKPLALSFDETALFEDTRAVVVRLPPLAARVLSLLRGDSRVEYVEPHAKVFALFTPDDPMLKEQWHLARIGAPAAWEFATGRGVTVAVVDTGIACENFGPFTKASDLNRTRCVEGYNFVNRTSHANDDQGHGTHVAGTIAQSTNNGLGAAGVAFDARLMPVKVLSARGWGTTSAVADGIRWAADHGARVINLSLGGPRNSRALQNAVNAARARGAVVVAAVGNSAGAVGYPGGCQGVIGVSASDANDGLAWFSSRGNGVDIGAPGVNVLQQTICKAGRDRCEVFGVYNGTSMASPHVAGAAALVVALGVSDPDRVESILKSSARPVDGAGEKEFGAGILDVQAAVRHTSQRNALQRLVLLALLSAGLFYSARKRGSKRSAAHPGFWLAALFGSVGLGAFLPYLLDRPLGELFFLAAPLPSWDLYFDAGLHRYLPLGTVLIPFGLSLVFGVKRAAMPLAGLSMGIAAYSAALLFSGDMGGLAARPGFTLWCGVNLVAGWFFARLLLIED